MEMKKDKSEKIIILVFVFIIMALVGLKMRTFLKSDNNKKKEPEKEKEYEQKEVINTGNFNIDIIKMVNANNDGNYLISPYNIEIALNMLREGADGNTKDEIDKIIGNRKINDVSQEEKIEIANALFIKNDYKNEVKADFTNVLKNKYNSEILYDEFKTPTVINNWVKEKTHKMIDGVISEVPNDFMLGMASALAIDVKWSSPFECYMTRSEEFTKIDNSKLNAEMMHQTYDFDVKYFKDDEAEGVIIPYQKEINSKVELEFVGIIPNGNVNDYVNNLTNKKLDNIFNNTRSASDKLYVHLSLPRFTYDYDVKDFGKILSDLGIKDAFNPELANFKRIIDIPNKNAYVSTAVHKTKIELNEEGTKAAAVTYFGMDTGAALMEKDWEDIYVKFNKPFTYLIREKNTNEILFFGVVFEPNEWSGSTCEE